MAAPDPEADLATLVATLTGRVLGTNLFRGSELAQDEGVPADCVFVQAFPGDRPQPLLGTGKDLKSADVKITVRGPPSDREETRTTARAIMAGVQRAAPNELSDYSLALLVESEPAYEDYDSSQCHYYGFSLTLQWVA